MKLSGISATTCIPLLLLPLVVAHGQELTQETGKKAEAIQQPGKPKDDLKKMVEDSKKDLASLEQEAAKGVLSAKNNGVELAVELKVVANKESTDIEIAWTIKYSGPRPPLIIVQPTLKLTTMSTTILVYAAPKGKDYALPFLVKSPAEMPGEKGYVIDAYGDRKLLPELPPMLSTIPHPDRFKLRTRTKEWFITVPAGTSAQGVLTISGSKLKDFLLTTYPGHFDPKEPPRLFVNLVHTPFDRGGDFNFDAWVGELSIPYNAVPALPKW